MATVGAWQGLAAQEVNTDALAAQREDSLKQEITRLSAQVDEADAETRNRKIWKNRAKFFNLNYVTNQTLTRTTDLGDMEWKSEFGAGLTVGRTYYLHKKPLFNMVKFGIDVAWMDISYAKYKQPDEWGLNPALTKAYGDGGWDDDYDYDDEMDEDLDLGLHQIDVSMQAGLSLTVNPVSHLKAAVYFRYVPTYSMVLIDESFGSGFVSNFAAGASVAYKCISVGIESRWGGNGTYKGMELDEDGMDYEDPDYDDLLKNDKWKMKTKSFRIYLSFRY